MALNTAQGPWTFDAIGGPPWAGYRLSTSSSTLYTHNKLNQMTGLSVTTGGVTQATAFTYDASGNMAAQNTKSGGSTYTYDDTNRLISLVQKDTSTGAFTKKSEYVYDGMSRKAVSREYSWDATLNNNVGGWVQSEEKRRVYDGMDVVQERDGTNTTKVNYTRSGNIGGLLSRSDSNGNFFFSYDGSGNVVELTDSTQQSVAEYSYDAWGNALRAAGVMASVNTYRYSTKEYQSASGLYDYGYRFYSPGLGRWINRDPLEEEGRLNLYQFVNNDPINYIDEDGLAPVSAGGGYHFIYSPPGKRGRLNVYDRDNGKLVCSCPASNVTDHPNANPNKTGGSGPAPKGDYPLSNGQFSDGRYVIDIGIKFRNRIALHAMAPGTRFSWAKTQGCIRVQEDDLTKLRKLVEEKGKDYITIR